MQLLCCAQRRTLHTREVRSLAHAVQFAVVPDERQSGARQLQLAVTPDEFQAWLAAWLPWITGVRHFLF